MLKDLMSYDLDDPLGPLREQVETLDPAELTEALADLWSIGEPPDEEEIAAVGEVLVGRGIDPAPLLATAQRLADARRPPPMSKETRARRLAELRALARAEHDGADPAVCREMLLRWAAGSARPTGES